MKSGAWGMKNPGQAGCAWQQMLHDRNPSFLMLHSSFTASSSMTRLSMMNVCRSKVFLPM